MSGVEVGYVGSRRGQTKVNGDAVLRLRRAGLSYADIADRLDICEATAWRICSNRDGKMTDRDTEYRRTKYRTGDRKVKHNLSAGCRSRALVQLSHIHPDEYKRLVNEQRASVGLPPLKEEA